MKYFFDTEFIEGFHKPFLGKKRHFIDLISIGIVCEDGREYYAISTDFKAKDADAWVKKNVISKLPDRYVDFMDSPSRKMNSLLWKSTERIKKEILAFMGCWRDQLFYRAPEGIEVYGYYSDYDWVLFCSLFGRMIDLPKGFPMYCKDLKQILDERAQEVDQIQYTTKVFSGSSWEVVGELPKSVINTDEWSFETKLQFLKSLPEYPKQINEHNAVEDAKWNMKLYNFLKTL